MFYRFFLLYLFVICTNVDKFIYCGNRNSVPLHRCSIEVQATAAVSTASAAARHSVQAEGSGRCAVTARPVALALAARRRVVASSRVGRKLSQSASTLRSAYTDGETGAGRVARSQPVQRRERERTLVAGGCGWCGCARTCRARAERPRHSAAAASVERREPHAPAPACRADASMRLPLLPLFMLPLVLARPAAAGICWSEMESNGRCTSVSAMRVERGECCAGGARAPAAWSPRDLADHEMFFHKILSGGVPCTACAESCAGVSCGPGRRCVVRGGRARCVCASSCRRAGQVCGSDGKTYKSLCRLRRRACRKPAKHLTLDYPGPCREGSCEGVRCGGGKQCVLDAELGAHCVRCGGCAVAGAPVCAVDGRTYAGLCALRHAACLHGRALPLAYRGPCIANATCSRITCGASQRCVSGGASGARCVSCGSCGGGGGKGGGGGGGGARRVLCASDARTYGSWCRLQRAACRAGTVLDPLHTGPCKGNASISDSIVTGERIVAKART